MDTNEFMESTTVRFEWTIRGLHELFESSKGETKSKVTKSAKFGGGRWQILFYPNSGIVNADGQGFVSLYLACEPTGEEKESAVNGKWTREGVYKFGFELRNVSKTILFNSKEANDHSFSWKTVNWGWAQFARRDTVYYQASTVRQADAILVICTITSSPVPPVALPSIPRQPVPKDLLDAMGSLLDDPAYSDVEFVLPRRRRRGHRSVYAARRLLRRVDYFDTMFESGFAEGACMEQSSTDLEGSVTAADSDAEMAPADDEEADEFFHRFQDSDDEDDNDDLEPEPEIRLRLPHSEADKTEAQGDWDNMDEDRPVGPQGSNEVNEQSDISRLSPREPPPEASAARSSAFESTSAAHQEESTRSVPGPPKARVVVKDVAYSTYVAVLYYIYTDTIVFAPLASSFTKHSHLSPPPTFKQSRPVGVSTPAVTAPEFTANLQLGHAAKASLSVEALPPASPSSRKEWIAEWQRNNQGKPRPCSAKAVFRLADKLDLQELKERAFQHIIKSLSVDNVAYEVFSDFSAAFEDVRKVEVQFFLDHWADIRGSEAMRNVWQQIRLGRHPGFEEVWPLIAVNLEFKPPSKADASKEGRNGLE
ncbi:MATH domain-containing protein [Phanerochaete sordida]|uniref:MATH domain-containing protein n=1 Tax=Phanerochaete sordida TaxID=48140 RepID=A0A9P3LAU4_9APHY|nr:MATH domain-containing protein [Phanerochaete sordida]